MSRSHLLARINRSYGTWRGLTRALLAYVELGSGRLDPFRLRRPDEVKRVVFVCWGNICRSPYAHGVAAVCSMNSASIGLSTTSGARSPTQALAAAGRSGLDMATHMATKLSDFPVEPGDLFLVMEVRHAHALRRALGPRDDVQICLLGMWCEPAMPHLHDPFTLSDEYFDSCFRRIAQAVRKLSTELPTAKKQRHPKAHVGARAQIMREPERADTST